MRKLLIAWLPVVLWGCGTPMVWQGPPGSSQQDLLDTRAECNHRAEAWRAHNAQVYQESGSKPGVNELPRASDNLYRNADQLFEQCMVAQGYKLVPQAQ